jgi:hypothetical protein
MVMYAVPKIARRPQLTASHKLLWPALEAVRQAGGEVRAVLAAVGLDEESASAPDTRVLLDQAYGVWRRCADIARDPALGIRLAGFTHPASTMSWPMPLALFEHMGFVSETLADAVVLQDRFMRLMRDGLRTTLELDGSQAVFRIDVPPDEPHAMVEFNLAVAVNVARRITRSDRAPIEVSFMHPAPARSDAHEAFFKSRVRWGAPFNGLIAPADYFTRKLPTANEAFRERVVRQAEKLLAALPSVDFF